MSDRPDPSTDFVGSIRWLMEKFDRFEKIVADANPERKTEWREWTEAKGDKERRREFDTTGRRELKKMRATV